MIDTREFLNGRYTGIGRVLKGLIDALINSSVVDEIVLLESRSKTVPLTLKKHHKIRIRKIPPSFIESEKALSDFTKNGLGLFISPYPKLPLFGVYCPAIHIVHDVLDLTHPAYRRRFKTHFDKFRLRAALKKADSTWYMSHWSKQETLKLVGFAGNNPHVRYSGIPEGFTKKSENDENEIIEKYGIQPGSVLIIGNGKPHKNLGVVLNIANHLPRPLVFIGVPENRQRFWKSKYPKSNSMWIDFVKDEDLPAILRNSFCLAQPSTAEGYGLPPLEAMACGVPAVVSDIPVLVETTGHNTLTANPERPEEWEKAFRSLENREIHQNLVKNGLAWVKPLRGKKGWKKHISDIGYLINREREFQRKI